MGLTEVERGTAATEAEGQTGEADPGCQPAEEGGVTEYSTNP